MNASVRSASARRGFTLVELLVALAIVCAFSAGVIAAFIQILQASDRAEATQDAIVNARSALETMASEVKAANVVGNRFFMRGINFELTYGDGIDNDGDSRVDEEVLDNEDNDGDYVAAVDDRHALIGTEFERQKFVNFADLGDGHVDEDNRFNNDILEFDIFPDPRNPVFRDDLIRYQVQTFDGMDRVLVRRLQSIDLSGNVSNNLDPLAFNVLSFDAIYLDPNRIPYNFVPEWNSNLAQFFADPKLPLPIGVYLSLTIYADTKPIEKYVQGQPVKTITLATYVNIEQMLKDVRFRNRK